MKRLLLFALITFTASLAFCAPPAKTRIPVDTVTFEFYGTITAVDTSILQICKTFGDVLPEEGTEGVLSKSFEMKMYNEIMNGWVEIGFGTVKYIHSDTVAFDIRKVIISLENDSIKTDPFKIFSEVKFTWAGSTPRDDLAYKTGMSYYNRDNELALEYFQRTLRLNPNYHKALNMIGIIKEKNNEFDTAIEYFKRALVIDEGNGTYLKNIAMAWFSQGKYAESYDYACQAIVADSTDAEAHFIKGMTAYYMLRVSDTDDVKQKIIFELDLALTLDPINTYYYTQRAYIRNEFGDREGACEDAKKVEILGGKDAEMLMNAYCKTHKKEK